MFRRTAFTLLITLALLLLGNYTIYSQDSFYQEAPMLAARVAVGELPPVDERLPRNPVLITPLERIGIYGGTWNLALINEDTFGFERIVAYENLVRWDPNWVQIIPNVAQSYEVNDDSTTYTFRLREGMRWSDGMPFTADDIMFWYDAVWNNPELNPRVRAYTFLEISSGDSPGLIVEKLSDYEVLFRFNTPQGLFLQQLAEGYGMEITMHPRHYLSQFHPDYNPEVAQLVAEAGVANWVELWQLKNYRFSPELPSLNTWVVEEARFEPSAEGEARVRVVRNPYYWKIDTEFNQLPYIDALEFEIVTSRDDISALALAGEIDMQDRNIVPALALPENRAAGGYDLYTLTTSFSNYMAISFNQTHTDLVKREIFRNRDFRIAMSHALNRPAMITASGLDVQPAQVAPLEGTPWYSETMQTQYLAYDAALANDYLDRAGYSQRDADGFRLGPDGERISITLMISDPTPFADYSIYLPLIEADWEAVGIEVAVEFIPRVDYEARSAANDFDVAVFIGEGGLGTLQEPRNFAPISSLWSHQGILWARWYNGLPSGEEPPAPVLESINLYRQVLQNGDIDEQIELMRQMIAIAEQEFHVIGIHEMPLSYGIIQPNFHNVPSFSFMASKYPNPAPTNPSQYFIDPQDE